MFSGVNSSIVTFVVVQALLGNCSGTTSRISPSVSLMEDAVSPPDLRDRAALAERQMQKLYELNHRFGTNYEHLSRVIRYG